MSEKKDCDMENCASLELIYFENALKQLQELVSKLVTQKKEERLGLHIKDDDKTDYDTFCTTTKALFGPDVEDHDLKDFFRKICNTFDARTEWCEVNHFSFLRQAVWCIS